MAQPPGSVVPPSEGFRERHRRQRRREFLDTALGIVTSEGLAALTMQRVTDELRCSVGSIYHYFGTKGALMAELQREALDVLTRSLLTSQLNLEQVLVAQGAQPPVAALARPVAAAHFWIAVEDQFPLEIELLRRQFTTPEVLLDEDEVGVVLQAALALLDLCRRLLDDAVAHGVLHPGPSVDRSIVLISGTTGVLLTSGLRRWDEDLFVGQRLARTMLADLLTAWGADPTALQGAEAAVSGLVAAGELVPSVPPADLEATEVPTAG